MSAQERLALITSGLDEVLHKEIIQEILEKRKDPLVIYWGTATTGRPHCGYFVPCLQIAKFLQAGCKVKILLADVHGFLDNLKAPLELVAHRATYYRFIITELLKAVGVDISRLEFVLGSSYQTSSHYTMDLFRLMSVITQNEAKKAGAEVVKQVDNATMSSLVYPIMQALDEQYLGVDAQFGGVDQRKIFVLAEDVLPKIGYSKRAHLMNPLVPGLTSDPEAKMSSSDPDSKIDLLDSSNVVAKKLKKAFAVPKDSSKGGLLSFVEHVLLPAGALQDGEKRFVVERREGEPLVYTDMVKMRQDYDADILTPQLLKASVTASLNKLLEPIQAAFQANPDWQAVEKQAYPPPPPKVKKEKKEKGGTRHPGRVQAQADGHVEGTDAAAVSLGTSVEQVMNDLAVQDKKT